MPEGGNGSLAGENVSGLVQEGLWGMPPNLGPIRKRESS